MSQIEVNELLGGGMLEVPNEEHMGDSIIIRHDSSGINPSGIWYLIRLTQILF